MSDFDWREYPDLLVDDEDHRSTNLFQEFQERATGELKKFLDSADDTHLNRALDYIHEYKRIAESEDKFNLKPWPRSKILVGHEDKSPGKLSGVMYLEPIEQENIYDVDQEQPELLFISAKFVPHAQIGVENSIDMDISSQLISDTKTLEAITHDGLAITYQLANEDQIEFNDLQSWVEPLKLDINSINIQ